MFTRELTNLTRESGKMVKLICEAQNLDTNNTNGRVSFVWKLNEVPVESDNRFKIRVVKVRMGKGMSSFFVTILWFQVKEHVFRSTLRVTKLEYFDRGFVDCIASNGVDKIKSSAFLEISQELHKWGESPRTRK